MLDPSLPFKFGLGLIFMAIGFLFIATGATVAMQEGMAGAKWLLPYLFISYNRQNLLLVQLGLLQYQIYLQKDLLAK